MAESIPNPFDGVMPEPFPPADNVPTDPRPICIDSTECPGSPPPPPPPTVIPPVATIPPIVDECKATIEMAEILIRKDIENGLAECNANAGGCVAVILGDIERDIGSANVTLQKCYQKVFGDLSKEITATWVASMPAGVPPPTQEQIEAALSGKPIPETAPISEPPPEQGGGPGVPGPVIPPPPVVIPPVVIPPIQVTPPSSFPPVASPPKTEPDPNAIVNPPAAETPPAAEIPGAGVQPIGQPPVVAPGVVPINQPAPIPTPAPDGASIPPLPGGICPAPTFVDQGNGTAIQTVWVPITAVVGGISTVVSCRAISQTVPYTPPGGGGAGGGGGGVPDGGGGGGTPAGWYVYALPNGQCGIIAQGLANIPQGSVNVVGPFSSSTDAGTWLNAHVNQICPPQTGGGNNGETPPTSEVPPGSTQPPAQQPGPNGHPPPRNSITDFCDPASWNSILSTITTGFPSEVAATGSLSQILGQITPDTSNGLVDALLSLSGLTGNTPAKIFTSLVFSGIGIIYDFIVSPNLTVKGCTSAAFVKSSAFEGLFSWVQHWFNIIPRSVYTDQIYSTNYLCQYLIPSGNELNLLASRGYVTNDEWDMGIKANGLCIPWQERLLDANHTRISAIDAFRLWKLEKITDEEFKQAWIRQGIDVDKEDGKFKDAMAQYPGMSDLIRMMVRDVEDLKVVDKLKLDEDFTSKWTGTLQQWGESQGVTDEVAKRYWRAHWQSPSPGQVFTWLHRLRPDDRDPNDKFLQLQVTSEDAKQLLQIADYTPGLVQNYIATAYKPLSVLQIRRLYRNGVLSDKDGIRRAFRDSGYDDRLARLQTDGVLASEAAGRAKFAGAIPAAEVSKALTNGLISDEDASVLLDKAGLDEEQIQTTIKAANTRAAIVDRKLRAEAIRKRYFMGEISDSELAGELTRNGIPDATAGRWLAVWSAQKAARQKEPTIAMLCTWYDKGIIDLPEYQRRVRNLNYSEDDALRVVQQCTIGIKEHKEKELQKALLKQEADQRRALSEQRRANREAAAAARAGKMMAERFRSTQVFTHKTGETVTTETDRLTQHPDVNVKIVTEEKAERSNGKPPTTP